MRVHAEDGDSAGALRIYKALWDLLDRDYAMEPSPATEELVANIKLGVLEQAPADRAVSAANDEFAVRMVRGAALQPFVPITPSVNALGEDPAGAAALCDAWRRRRSQPSGARVLAASCRMSRPFP